MRLCDDKLRWMTDYLGPLARPSDYSPRRVFSTHLPGTRRASGAWHGGCSKTPLARDAMRLDGCAGTSNLVDESKRFVPALYVDSLQQRVFPPFGTGPLPASARLGPLRDAAER